MHLTQPPHFLAESRSVKLEEKLLKSSQKNCSVPFVSGRITSFFLADSGTITTATQEYLPLEGRGPKIQLSAKNLLFHSEIIVSM